MPDVFAIRAEDLELPAPDPIAETMARLETAFDDHVNREIERVLGVNFWWRNGAEHYWPRGNDA